jgi:predicted metalloprotease with PDZ domain
MAVPALLTAQAAQCPEGRPSAGDIGIRRIECHGPSAACGIYGREDDGSFHHNFSVEPTITEIASAESAGGLAVGDRIVAVDSVLITTREGGRRLANLPVNAPVRVLVRRQGALREYVIRAERGCGIRGITVRSRSD